MKENATVNAGYTIIRVLPIDDRHALVIGHHPTAPAPYVCWDRTSADDGTYSYDTGGYCSTFRQALLVLSERIHNRYDYLPLEGGHVND